jgi:hypothetical protein
MKLKDENVVEMKGSGMQRFTSPNYVSGLAGAFGALVSIAISPLHTPRPISIIPFLIR